MRWDILEVYLTCVLVCAFATAERNPEAASKTGLSTVRQIGKGLSQTVLLTSQLWKRNGRADVFTIQLHISKHKYHKQPMYVSDGSRIA
jgi:hypothetical protein